MIKLIASDLDGTLLQDDGSISEETVRTIKEAEQQGIHFMVATGRSYQSAKQAITRAGLHVPILCMNGANLYDHEGKLLIDIPFDVPIAKEIVNAIDTNKIYLEMYTSNGVYAPEKDQFVEMLLTILREKFVGYTDEQIKAHINQRFQEETFTFTDDFLSVLDNPTITPYKLLAFSFDKKDLDTLRQTFANRDDIYVTSSGFDNVEFNHKKATKGHTLLAYAKTLGVSSEEIMAIGDNENDLPMLTNVKYGVAMDNASDFIKAHVNYTTASNNNHGVKQAIEQALTINASVTP
jgi:hypothetical protein